MAKKTVSFDDLLNKAESPKASGTTFDDLLASRQPTAPAAPEPIASHAPTAPSEELPITGFENYQAPDVEAALEPKPGEGIPVRAAKGVGRGVYGMTTWPVTVPAAIAEAAVAPGKSAGQRVREAAAAIHPAEELFRRAGEQPQQQPEESQFVPPLPFAVSGFEN